MKGTVTFCVLHYQNVNDTIACVDSILGLEESECVSVVVVDNNSPNKSGELLCAKYEGNSQVNVILNKENLGFAKGNNVGYSYLRKVLKPEFICIVNSDTLIHQKDFIACLNRIYDSIEFDVLGPRIIDSKGGDQNPTSVITSKKVAMRHIFLNIVLIFLSYLNVDTWFESLKKAVRYIISKKATYKLNHVNQMPLHGSALIFSKRYIDRFESVLDLRTFMYKEEDLLFQRIIKYDLISIYEPSLVIFHKEDGSLNKTFQKASIARRFTYMNMIKSTRLLLDELN